MFKDKRNYLFLLYFIILYIILSLILLNNIAQPLIVLWEMIIKNIFKNTLNYAPFIFVPICSGVISISIYLSIIFSWKYAFKNKINYFVAVWGVIFMMAVNLLRLILVLLSEKVSIEFAKATHVASWFLMGAIILYLAINSFKKE